MVLDEADRMFDLGFIKDIRYLLRRMPHPEKRLSMLFSATLSLRVTELAYEHMNNPVTIEVVAEQVTADKVNQSVYYPAMDERSHCSLACSSMSNRSGLSSSSTPSVPARRCGATLKAMASNAASSPATCRRKNASVCCRNSNTAPSLC